MPDSSPILRPVDVDRIGRVFVREGTSDTAVLEQIFHTEEFNISTAPQFAWIRAAYDRTLEAGQVPLIVDCGANNGLSALYFASHLPRAKIVGIEPARDNVELARKNRLKLQLREVPEDEVRTTDEIWITSATKEVLAVTQKIVKTVDATKGIRLVTRPDMTALAIMSDDPKVSILALADVMEGKGWQMERQQCPDSLHVSFLVID